jgi:pimeloyl-ACP methyl ester carboxylesterase
MRATVNGVEIGYDIYGAAESGTQTLVLLHAFPLSREQWREQGQMLAREAGVRVIAPDLRGVGESGLGESGLPPNTTGPVTVEQMADDVRGLLDLLGIATCVLGGLSMGGYVAYAAWRAYPERIRGLILADTRATADSPEARANREATAQLAATQGALAVLERDLPKLLCPLTLRERPDIVAFTQALARVNSGAGVAAVARGLAQRPDASALLPTMTCPALVLVGEQDAITPVDDARGLFARIPDAFLEVIPDAGHLSNLEQPDRFAEAVVRFLDARFGDVHP